MKKAVITIPLLFLQTLLIVSSSLAAGPFTNNGNGTLTDTGTNLVWLKNARCTDTVGGIANPSGDLMSSSAVSWSNALANGSCGLEDGSLAGDWHLPTIDELKSLICGPDAPVLIYNGCNDSNAYNPSGISPYNWLINQGFTTFMAANYLSSSTQINIIDIECYKYINMYTGEAQIVMPSSLYFLPVRSAQAINQPIEATDFVYPVLGISQTDPLTNNKDPLIDGWAGKGVGQYSAANGHLGQDYYLSSQNSAGKPVFAIANGEIVEVLNGPGIYGWCDDDDHGWGPVVVIKHYLSSGFNICSSAIKDPGSCGTDLNPNVVYSLYGHLSKESIKDLYKGQIVGKGQQIGVIGQYGVDLVSWTTNHLHFELKDQFAFDSEGTWYTNRSHDGVCPEPTIYICSTREIKGVGTGYSHVLGFAPHRYIPNTFLLSNMINPPQTLTVSSDTNSSFTAVQDAYNSMTKNGQSLQMQAQVFSENLDFTNNLTVLLKGGYDSNYQTNSGWTTIFGSLTIRSGSVEVDRICIQ